MMGKRIIPLGLLAVAAAVLIAGAAPNPRPARAAFPGANGKIAFESRRDTIYGVYTMNDDGSGQRFLTRMPPSSYRLDSRQPAWSPDGSQIAFIRGSFVDVDIFVMNPGRGPFTQLTAGPTLDLSPAWSPDGSRLAFLKMVFEGERTGPASFDLYVMNADGSGQVRLTDSPEVYEGEPTWSPDGSRIAFESDPFDNRDIYVMSADGSGVTRLTDDPASDGSPAWSPDGSQIAFQTTRDGDSEVYVMDADGSGQVNLTNSPDVYEGEPAWSPDGSKIAFSSGPIDSRDIYVMDADGSGRVNLTSNPDYDCCPDWQPLAIGNVNCQGGIDSIDADLVLRFDAGLVERLVCDQNADVNDDGTVNAIDAALILQYVAGLIGSLPSL